MAHEIQPAVAAFAGEVIDPGGLSTLAAEVAARQRSPATRRTYAAVYRSFCGFLSANATAGAMTAESVRAYRDALEQAGRTPATVAKHSPRCEGSRRPWVPTRTCARSGPPAWLAASPAPSPRTSSRGSYGCPTGVPAKANEISRCCTCSAPPGCGAPRPPTCSSATLTSAVAPPTRGCAARSAAPRAGGSRSATPSAGAPRGPAR